MNQHYVALPDQGRTDSELEGGCNHTELEGGSNHTELPRPLAPPSAGGVSADLDNLGGIHETLEGLALKKAPLLPVRVHLRDRERADGDSEDACSGHGPHQHEQETSTRHARSQQERPASPRMQQSMERERELEREAEGLSLQAEREKEKGRMKDAQGERARAKERRKQEQQRAQEWKLWEEQRKREQKIEQQKERKRELEQHRREVEAWKREREQQAQRQASPHAPGSVASAAATQRLGVDDQDKESLRNHDAGGGGGGKLGGGKLGPLIMDPPVWMEAASCTSSVSSSSASSRAAAHKEMQHKEMQSHTATHRITEAEHAPVPAAEEAGLNVKDGGQSLTPGATVHAEAPDLCPDLSPDLSLHAPSPHEEDKGRQKGRTASIGRLSLSLKALKGALKIGLPRSASSRPPVPSEAALARDGTPATAGAPVGGADADASAEVHEDVSNMLPATPSSLALVHPSFSSPDQDALQQVLAPQNRFALFAVGD